MPPDTKLVSTVRKQRETIAGVQLAFSFFTQPKTPAPGMETPTFRVDSPISVKPFWKCPHRHTQRPIFYVIPYTLIAMKN